MGPVPSAHCGCFFLTLPCFHPTLACCFLVLTTVKGGGAFLNGEPIRVSDTAQLSKAVVGTELGTRRDDAFMDACFNRIRTLGQRSRSLRCSGSCALNLCSVAMGRWAGWRSEMLPQNNCSNHAGLGGACWHCD